MKGNLCTEKLRCSDPDLKVILNFTDEESSKLSQKVYPMYSQVLAKLSNFFDTSLSVNMKEKANGEVILNDVTPDLFLGALKFVQNPLASHLMKPQDALGVLPFYHVYEFKGGIELCDFVISEHIKAARPVDIDQLVKTTAMAHTYSLPNCTKEGTKCINSEILSREDHPIRAAMLTPEHIEALKPLFKESLLTLPSYISKEDLDNSIFPKYFAKCASLRFFRGITTQTPTLKFQGKLSGTGPVQFQLRKDATKEVWKYNSWQISKGASGDMDWTISVGTPRTLLYKCPNSKDLDIPPPGPWEAVDRNLEGQDTPFLTFYECA